MSSSLHITIVGAGVAGLCAGIALGQQGHTPTILERAHELSSVGAGIHLPPNATLLLQRWGVLGQLEGKGVTPTGINLRRYVDSSILAQVGGRKDSSASVTPYLSVKRSDYQEVLRKAAIAAGCEIRLGSKALVVDEDAPSLTLENGAKIYSDLIIVAEGMNSHLRKFVTAGEDVSPVPYPMATFRAWAPTDTLTSDQKVAALLEQPATNVWLGSGRHAIFYRTEGGEVLTINGTYPSRSAVVGAYSKATSVAEVQAQFHDFDPVVKAIMANMRECKSWALAEVPRLPTWISRSGKVALIGDAAHGMLQFLAQGAAMATEDAGSLAECIKRIRAKKDIPAALRAYERSRKWRCERVQSQARRNGDFVHMPNGEEQEHRDRRLSGNRLATDQEVDCGPLFDTTFVQWLYDHDTEKHTRNVLSEIGL